MKGIDASMSNFNQSITSFLHFYSLEPFSRCAYCSSVLFLFHYSLSVGMVEIAKKLPRGWPTYEISFECYFAIGSWVRHRSISIWDPGMVWLASKTRPPIGIWGTSPFWWRAGPCRSCGSCGFRRLFATVFLDCSLGFDRMSSIPCPVRLPCSKPILHVSFVHSLVSHSFIRRLFFKTKF